MKDTGTRIDEAVALIENENFQNTGADQQANRYRANWLRLQAEFSNLTFAYGTIGPNPLNNESWQKGGGSSVLIKAVAKFKMKLAKKRVIQERRRKEGRAHEQGGYQREFDNLPAITRRGALKGLAKDMYDPGPRANELARRGCQMMDMYYGDDGNHNNHLWRLRRPLIAELVHYAMEFHRPRTWVNRAKGQGDGRWVRPAEKPFDPNKPGWQAFKEAFPNAKNPGNWHQPATTAVYGQSATKEMSKIIRECVREFGGTIIFDIKGVFGHNLLGPAATRHVGDTDLELEDILNSVRGRITTDVIPFGNGYVHFKWGGRSVVPTRAHFLMNWNWNPRFGGKTMNTMFNRKGEPGANMFWTDYLEAIMTNDLTHGLSPNWNKLEDFPHGTVVAPHGRGKAAAIEELADVLSGTRA